MVLLPICVSALPLPSPGSPLPIREHSPSQNEWSEALRTLPASTIQAVHVHRVVDRPQRAPSLGCCSGLFPSRRPCLGMVITSGGAFGGTRTYGTDICGPVPASRYMDKIF